MEACQLSTDPLSFIKANRKTQLSQEDVSKTLQSHIDDFPVIFHLLSELNQVINASTYLQSHLYRNLNTFTEEQLYYIVEGIKNQLVLGFDDFFIVMHRFFSCELLRHRPVQGLLLYILQNFDYRVREFLITTDLISKFFTEEILGDIDATFYLKWLKVMLENDNEVFLIFLDGLRIEIRLPEPKGCRKYFKEWYEDLSSIKKRIKISFY